MADDTSTGTGATPDAGLASTDATSGEQQQPDAARDASVGQGNANTLSDTGRATLDKERDARRDADRRRAEAERRATDAEKRLADLEDAGKSEIERAVARLDRQGAELDAERKLRTELQAELARRDLLELKRTIANELGIPMEAAHRLQGDDARSLRADAQRYLDERGRSEGSIGVGRGGAAGRGGGVDMNTVIRQASGRQ